MAAFSGFLLFIFGTAIGSFLNVLILRYKPERPLFDWRALSGRSHCPACGRTLSPAELIPFFSFLFLRGKCGSCRARISLQYPLVELLTGLAFLGVPLFLNNFYGVSQELFFSFALAPWHYFLAGLWVFAFVCFIAITAIDLKHCIIPDELVVMVGVAGALAAWTLSANVAASPAMITIRASDVATAIARITPSTFTSPSCPPRITSRRAVPAAAPA